MQRRAAPKAAVKDLVVCSLARSLVAEGSREGGPLRLACHLAKRQLGDRDAADVLAS